MVATVNKVDQPDQCLRIRQGPGPNHAQVGCAKLGSLLRLTGVIHNNWAEVREPVRGWVTASQISASGAFPAKPATSGQRAQQKVPGSSPTTKMFTDPAFDQQAQTQKQIEEAWADVWEGILEHLSEGHRLPDASRRYQHRYCHWPMNMRIPTPDQNNGKGSSSTVSPFDSICVLITFWATGMESSPYTLRIPGQTAAEVLFPPQICDRKSLV